MSDLYFTDRPRAAALRLLDTQLGRELDGHYTDDGRLLTVSTNVDVWMQLGPGLRHMLEVLEQLAGHRSTVTLLDVAHLDVPCRTAVVMAMGDLFGLRVEVAA